MTAPDHDVLIVGAGISGLSMAAHLRRMCPDKSFAIIERRAALGGTWDLFRYPGVRSDSDMHTLGFSFQPWTLPDAIAQGSAIRAYLHETAQDHDLGGHIRFGTHVIAADWHANDAVWQVTVVNQAGQRVETTRWLYLASGYYDYDEPYRADISGLADFGGTVVHPQFWPEKLDYRGRQVVVIGSGATAVTIVPAMAQCAARVTMLQRTPTWMAAGPRRDIWAELLARCLPRQLAARLAREKNIRLNDYVFKLSRRKPEKVADKLGRMLRDELGDLYRTEHFEPPYGPWQQRLCLVPDGDLFAALKNGDAHIVTDTIAGFDTGGVKLDSGRYLPADIVVTATGLQLTFGGKIAIAVDGKPVDWTRHFFYRGTMFSNIPNLSVVFGYLNASWTLRADANAAFACRVLNHMDCTGTQVAVPHLAREDEPEPVEPFDYSSGYLARARHLMPMSAAALPWKLNHDYLADRRDFRKRPVDDGVLGFHRANDTAEIAR